MRLTIAKKLYGGFGIIIVLTLAFAGYIISGFRTFRTDLSELKRMKSELAEMLELTAQLREIQVIHYRWLHALEIAVQNKTEFTGEMDPTKCGFGTWYYNFKNPYPEIDHLLKSLEIPHRHFHETGAEILKATKAGRRARLDELQSAMFNEVLPQLMKPYETMMDGLLPVQEKEKADINKLVEKKYTAIREKITVTVVMALLGLLLSLTISFLTVRRITKPLSLVVSNAAAISDGDLRGENMTVRSRDEIGELCRIFNKMQDSLKNLIKTLSQLSNYTASSAANMSQTTEQSAQTMEQIQNSIQQVAAATTQVAKSSQEIAHLVNNTNKIVEAGAQKVDDVIVKFQTVGDMLDVSAGLVEKLNRSSSEISEIVGFITKIADQTNLLALNAAIEAARAGEAGKGFAVVADEVRKLAESSSQSAERITKIIKEIQSDTTSVVEASHKSKTESAAVMGLAQKMQQGFAEITTAIKGISQQVEQIAATSEETAASAEEITASAEEQTAANTEIATSSNGLSEQVSKLKDAIGRYKV